MANLARVRVTLNGAGVIGPSVSTFYFNEGGSGWTSALNTFFTSIQNRIPAAVAWTVPNTGDLINISTGAISGAWTDGTAVQVAGTGSAGYQQGVGHRIVWNTSGLRGGRRVKGSTYIVPHDHSMLDGAGTLGPTPMGTVLAAATVLIGVGTNELVIYSKPHKDQADGQASVVTSASVPDQISWLRSRRT